MASALKWNVGTALTWRDSGGDYLMTLTALAAQAGRIGARGDLGAWPHANTFRWYLETAWVSTPVQNETLDFYVAGWDTDTPGSSWAQVGSGDAALVATQRANLRYVGSVTAETATTGVFSSGGIVTLPFRYVSPALWNNSAARALAAVGTTPTILRLTPTFPEAQ